MQISKIEYRKILCLAIIGLLVAQVFTFAVVVERVHAVSHEWYYKPANYSELVSWYQELEANYSDYMEVFKANVLFGTGTVTGGYDLYYVRITNESTGFHKPEVFFSGGPHGNEKIGTIGLYWFADWMMRHALHPDFDNPKRDWLQWLLNNREIYICVCHNPDGFDRNRRYDDNDWDLNREADHDGPGSPTGGIWGSVNGKTLREFVNNHTLRIGVWFHDGARAILTPWRNQHPGIDGTSPISGRTYQRVTPDFYFYDAACLRLGDYIGDYGGDLNKNNIGNSYTLGFGGPGVIPHWAYGGDVEKNPAEDGYVDDETFGNYPGAGMLGLDPEVYGSGNPPESTFGNDTIHRFGAEIRRYVLYCTDLAQPYLRWQSGTPENNTLVNLGTSNFKWQVDGCLVVDYTSIQWGADPDPINNPDYTTVDYDEHAGDYLGGTGWDNAEDGDISGVTYSEDITIDTPGDYYFVAKAQVDQAYANVLAPGEYGDTSYLRLVKERTNSTYYEELEGTDGLEQINGQLWWYSPVIHVRVSGDPVQPLWWNISWPYRKEITIDHTKVETDSDLSNFPVLINVTDSDLTSKAQEDGDDIAFTDENGVQLNHEIELYENGTGHLVAWVNANLSSTVDTILYMYYGNATAENQENIEAVWDSNYMMVQHLEETSGTHYDSTANDNDGSASGVVQDAAGQIDGADDFDGTDDYVEVPHDDTLTGFTEAMTASAWIKLDDVSARQTILNKYNITNNQRGWAMDYCISPQNSFGFVASAVGETGQWEAWTASYTPTSGTWYYVAVVWQSNQIPTFYVNGEQVTTGDTGTVASIYNNTLEPLYIGRAYNTASPDPPGRYLDGVIDEARVSDVARSASWVATCYNNQHDPSSFYSVGSEETIPEAPIVSLPSPSDGAVDVSIGLTELGFNLTDIQEDQMNYTVTTSPDVGSDSATNVDDGRYTVAVSGLGYGTTYTWHVNVTDGTNWNNKTYSFTTETESALWWNISWPYRKEITIDHTKVETDSDLSNFPVLINMTDGDLASKAQDDGDDIVFTDDDGVQLDHEIELYDNDTGYLVAWVSANLSSTVDTVLYMYYGNATAENQENIEAVWDSNCMMVQHLEETSGTHYDSTANDNDGSASGVVQDATGQIDGADDFDGIDDYVEVAHDDTLAGYTEAMTASVWIKLDDVATWQTILNKYDTVGDQRGWVLDYRVGANQGFGFVASAPTGQSTDWEWWYAPYVPSSGNWYYVTVVWQSDQIPTFYVNGEQVSTERTGTVASIYNNTGTPLYIGRAYSAASPERNLDGIIDEIRVSDVARSASWVATCYSNQYDPSEFYNVGSEETLGVLTTVRIDPATTEALLDEDYTIYIEVTNVADLYAWEFQLDYDPSILNLTSASIVTGGLNEPTYTYYNLTDKVNGHLWWAVSTRHPTTTGISYDQHYIFEMHFHTMAIGTSNLDLCGTHLSDNNINPISHTVVNGSITVIGAGEIDLTVTNISVLDHGCSLYANDTYVNDTAYYYPVEVTVHNSGTISADPFYVELEVYWINGSSSEGSAEILVSGLAAGASTTVNFTSLFHPMHTGHYRLTATADSQDDVAETNETNNVIVQSDIPVTVIGDIKGDGLVNILDAVVIARAWDAYPTSPHWNVCADLNHDGHVDILDGVRIGLHWGETW